MAISSRFASRLPTRSSMTARVPARRATRCGHSSGWFADGCLGPTTHGDWDQSRPTVRRAVHAIRLHAFGPPSNLVYEEVEDPAPTTGQLRSAVAAGGV